MLYWPAIAGDIEYMSTTWQDFTGLVIAAAIFD